MFATDPITTYTIDDDDTAFATLSKERMLITCKDPFNPGCSSSDSVEPSTRQHRVDTNRWVCDCVFMANHLLPCRHVMYVRKIRKEELIVPTVSVSRRWYYRLHREFYCTWVDFSVGAILLYIDADQEFYVSV